MTVSFRRLIYTSLIVAGVLLIVVAGRLALEWRQALEDVDAMIVTPVTLPEPTSIARQAGTASPAAGVVVPTAVPTALPQPGSTTPVNILLLGTDRRPNETGPTRTDAIVLVHINPQDGRVAMLSMPRDLWVEIPGYGQARINSAYPVGEKLYGPGGGAALIKRTVGNLLGLTIHHFVLIDFDGFRQVIDLLGGVQVDVPQAIYDPAYPTDDYRTIEVRFEPGLQVMDGERALIYARTRHSDSDFGRNQRQQQVLMAIFERVRERGLLQQLTSLDDYTGALRNYVRTDLARGDMLDLAYFARDLSAEDVQRFAIDSQIIIALEKPATFAVDPRALVRLVSQITGSASAQAGGEDQVK